MRSQTNTNRGGRRALLVAVLLAGIGLNGVAIHAGITMLTDPTTAFTSGTRLPGGRSLWLSQRPACRSALVPMGCQYHSRTADPRVSVSYYPPAARRVVYTIRLPQR